MRNGGITVSLQGIAKHFQSREAGVVEVFNGLHLDVRKGEFVALVGHSGCGKSTLLNMVAGLETYEGHIEAPGTSSAGVGGFAYCFQEPRLLEWRTVRQNLEFVLAARHIPKPTWNERIERYLDMVGLRSVIEQFPLRLSGGMRQRVAIARALVVEPLVLLMDEPFSALDELTARTLRGELSEILIKSQPTVMFVTHNPLEAAQLADRIVVLGGSPSGIVREVTITADRPRDEKHPEVLAAYDQALEAILELKAEAKTHD